MKTPCIIPCTITPDTVLRYANPHPSPFLSHLYRVLHFLVHMFQKRPMSCLSFLSIYSSMRHFRRLVVLVEYLILNTLLAFNNFRI